MQGYPRNILKGRMAFGDDRNNHPQMPFLT